MKSVRFEAAAPHDATRYDAEIIRRLTPVERLRMTAQLYHQARDWKRAAIKAQHPDWPEEQVEALLRKVFLHGPA